MSSPSSSTRPVTQPPSVISCIRFSVRRKVLFPQPDGPMRACTWLAANESVTPFTAVYLPYIADILSVAMRGATPPAAGSGRRVPGTSRTASTMAGARTVRHHAGDDVEHEHQQDEHQRRGPRVPVPLLVRARGVAEH